MLPERMALRVQIVSDEAEEEGFGDSKARTTTKYEPICAATPKIHLQGAGADFPDFFVARRLQTPGMRRSSLRELEKIGRPAPPSA